MNSQFFRIRYSGWNYPSATLAFFTVVLFGLFLHIFLCYHAMDHPDLFPFASVYHSIPSFALLLPSLLVSSFRTTHSLHSCHLCCLLYLCHSRIGLVLALQGDKVKVGGGSWTPATCQVTTKCYTVLCSAVSKLHSVCSLSQRLLRQLFCCNLQHYSAFLLPPAQFILQTSK